MALALTYIHEPVASATSPLRSLSNRLRDTSLINYELYPKATFEIFHDPTDDESTGPPAALAVDVKFKRAGKAAFSLSENDENQENIPPTSIRFLPSSPPRRKNAGIAVLGELCIDSLAIGLRVAASAPSREPSALPREPSTLIREPSTLIREAPAPPQEEKTIKKAKISSSSSSSSSASLRPPSFRHSLRPSPARRLNFGPLPTAKEKSLSKRVRI